MTAPKLVVIAGPNGAGKTTAAFTLLPKFLSVYEFVNADEIARGISPFNPEGVPVQAGKLMLERINELISARKSFAFESTLSGRTHVETIKRCKAAGFQTYLIYIWISSVDMAIERVKSRVRQGGHNIPEEVIRRRFRKSKDNLFDLYLPTFDRVTIMCGDGKPPSLIAGYAKGRAYTHNDKLWKMIQKR